MASGGGDPQWSAPGKLKAVARAWLAGPDDGEVSAALAAFGAADRELMPPRSPTPVWPENEQSVSVFFALNSQWTITPAGMLHGIDYGVVPAVLEMMDVPRSRWRRVFGDLRTMEREVLRASEERK